MERMDSFDLIASDNPDLLLIASIVSTIKALRLNAKNHLLQRDAYKNRLDVSQRNGDTEKYSYYLDAYLDEDYKYRLIVDQLHEFGITDESCKGLRKTL